MTTVFLETTGERHLRLIGGLTALERRVREVAKQGATKVLVRMEGRRAGLLVEVADDGIGGAVAGGGLGLPGLADRVDAVGGRFSIEGEPGAGTRVVAELPCGS